jgi:hypothetical protein
MRTLDAVGIMGSLLVLSGCSMSSPPPTPRQPARWVVVEARTVELPTGALEPGNSALDPGARMLTFQPLYREDVEWEIILDPRDYYVEKVTVSPSTWAMPGETVRATVRVGNANPRDRYRLTARPRGEEVRILGASEVCVRGTETAIFCFTSLMAGRGGIEVTVERRVD